MSKNQILIVEDDSIVAEGIKTSLTKLGYVVTGIASSGESALGIAEDKRPDLVLMDIVLKGEMNGIETAEQIRTHFNIPVIYLTAYAQEELLERAKITEPFGYIIKPFSERELKIAIEMALYKHKMERELLESREWLATTLRSIGDAVIATDTEGNVVFLNPVAEALTGWTEKEASGRPLDEIMHLLDRASGKRIENLGQNLIFSSKPVPLINDDILVSKTGQQHIIADTGAPIRRCEEQFGIVLVFHDKTQQFKVEEQLRQAQKMEAVGTLTGGIAHDFNNLLAIMLGNADFLDEHIAKDDPAYEYLAEIKTAGHRATALIGRLLAFSRRQITRQKVINFNQTLIELEKMLQRLIREDIHLKMATAPNLWPLKIDPGQMEQVIMNLVVNARDAMPQGGILTMETANVNLDDGHFRDHGVESPAGGYVLFTVSDNGLGMDTETLSRVFDPFFTTKAKGKGTGLGLATVYGIIKQNNGFIWTYSEPGRGTTFKIYLPRCDEYELAVEKEKAPAVSLRGSETILIAEDDHPLRKMTRRMLERYGYRVIDAEDGKEALRVFHEYEGTIELLLTDVVMPDMSGPELAKRLSVVQPGLRVVYMSGYSDNAIARHGVLDADVNFIEKPFSHKTLAGKVRMVLDAGRSVA